VDSVLCARKDGATNAEIDVPRQDADKVKDVEDVHNKAVTVGGSPQHTEILYCEDDNAGKLDVLHDEHCAPVARYG
jgi:hypothetical protein